MKLLAVVALLGLVAGTDAHSIFVSPPGREAVRFFSTLEPEADTSVGMSSGGGDVALDPVSGDAYFASPDDGISVVRNGAQFAGAVPVPMGDERPGFAVAFFRDRLIYTTRPSQYDVLSIRHTLRNQEGEKVLTDLEPVQQLAASSSEGTIYVRSVRHVSVYDYDTRALVRTIELRNNRSLGLVVEEPYLYFADGDELRRADLNGLSSTLLAVPRFGRSISGLSISGGTAFFSLEGMGVFARDLNVSVSEPQGVRQLLRTRSAQGIVVKPNALRPWSVGQVTGLLVGLVVLAVALVVLATFCLCKKRDQVVRLNEFEEHRPEVAVIHKEVASSQYAQQMRSLVGNAEHADAFLLAQGGEEIPVHQVFLENCPQIYMLLSQQRRMHEIHEDDEGLRESRIARALDEYESVEMQDMQTERVLPTVDCGGVPREVILSVLRALYTREPVIEDLSAFEGATRDADCEEGLKELFVDYLEEGPGPLLERYAPERPKEALLVPSATNDVILRCAEGKRIFAHKCVLMARCHFFEAMFGGNFVESRADVVPVQQTHGALLNMVYYMYTDTLEEVDGETVVEEYQTAAVWSLLPYADHCERFLVDNLEDETVVLVYLLSKGVESNFLTDACMEYMVVRYDFLASTDDFCNQLSKQEQQGIEARAIETGSTRKAIKVFT